MSGRHGNQNKKRKAPKRNIAIADEASSEEPIYRSPKAEYENRERKDKYPMYKPPDSTLALWGVLLGAAVAFIYFMQWQAMTRAMVVDQRAWIAVMKADLPSIQEVGPALVGSVRIIDSGKTPAKKVTEQFIIEKVRNGDEPTLDYSVSHSAVERKVIFPGSFEDYQVSWMTNAQGFNFIPITQTEVSEFRSGDVFFVLFGRVDYRDMFGTEHWVKFCTWNGNQSTGRTFTARKCSDYNDTDDER